MARVFGLDKIKVKLKLLTMLKDKELYERIGRYSVRRMQKVIRAGVSPVTNRRFKRLTAKTKSSRAQLAKYNKTSSFYSKGKSNVHFTGQLIKSLKYAVKGRKVSVKAEGTRRPYKNQKGKAVKNTPTNEQLAGYLKDMGRDFIGVDDRARAEIRQMVVRHINKKIRELRLGKRKR